MEVHTKYNRTIKKKVSKFGRDFQKVLLMLEIITFKKKTGFAKKNGLWSRGSDEGMQKSDTKKFEDTLAQKGMTHLGNYS